MISGTEGAKWCGGEGLRGDDIVGHVPRGLGLLAGIDIVGKCTSSNDIQHCIVSRG